MTARNAARLLIRALTLGVLVVSSVYLLLYLYRWEWNRAVISGVFFLGAEMVVVSTALSNRLARLERRLDEGVVTTAAPPVAVDVDRPSPFAWLDPAEGRLGVFVPFLMGAGVILSAVAFVVERVAGALAPSGPAGAGPAAHRIVDVGPRLPSGGLLDDAGPPGPADLPPARGARPMSPIVAAVVALVLGLATVRGVDALADAMQARPDPHPKRTTLAVDVWVRDERERATEEAAVLAVACQARVRLDEVEVAATGPGRARLTVTGLMGEHTRRRFEGCLEDATLERVRATVVAVTLQAAPRAPGT